MTTTVLVSGASIAGPALAYWLHRAGFAVTVVERAGAPRDAPDGAVGTGTAGPGGRTRPPRRRQRARPDRYARTTSCARSRAPSFVMARCTCARTVNGLRNIRSAIS